MERNRHIARRLVELAKPYRSRIFLALLAMVGTATIEPMFVKALQLLIDHGFGKDPDFSLWLIPGVLVSIFLFRGMCTFATAYFNNWFTSRIQNDLRRLCFDRLLRFPVARFHKQPTGTIINTVIGDVRQVTDMVNSVLLAAVRDTLKLVGLLAYLLYLNWQLTMVAVVILPTTALIVRTTMSRVRRLNRDNQRVTAELTQVVDEASRGHQVIRVFAGERYESARFETRSQALRGFMQRSVVAASATVPVTQIATAVAVSVVIVRAIQAGMTSGEFSGFLTAMLMMLAPLKALVEVNGPIQRGMVAAETVFDIIDAEAEADPGTRELGRARGDLTFEHVSFRYHTEPDARWVLDDVSLQVPAGSTVALVGMSGGGKSTLASLVTRFYAPERGRLLLDGIPYDEIRLTSLRAQMALVSQNVVLFDDTLAANIAYGVEQVDPQRLDAAIRAAHLADVVAALPEGVNTPIGENGMRLSGGQRQRVAIARAIYKDAPILILDEATSALDNESERAVQAALDTLMAGRTTLVIAHRLSTIERADNIVVVDQGRIVEQGRHEELLARGGVYANLYQLQFTEAAA
jgi:subfamily B ATP-binding cassette protein MsbA